MALKYAMEAFLGSKTVAQLRVEEHNEEVRKRAKGLVDVSISCP